MEDKNKIVKPGWRTTEFWVTIATIMTSLMFLGGVISRENLPDINYNITNTIDAGFLIAGNIIIACKYYQSRNQVKTKYIEEQAKTTRSRNRRRKKKVKTEVKPNEPTNTT